MHRRTIYVCFSLNPSKGKLLYSRRKAKNFLRREFTRGKTSHVEVWQMTFDKRFEEAVGWQSLPRLVLTLKSEDTA